MAVPPTEITRAASRQLYIEKLAASFGNDVIPYLNRIERGTRSILNKLPQRLSDERKAAAIEEIDKLTKSELQAYINEYKVNNRQFGAYEAEKSAEVLDDVVTSDSFKSTPATPAQVNALAVSTPIKLGDNLYTTYNSYLSNYWRKHADQINGIVVNGFNQSIPTDEIASGIMRQISTEYDNSSLSRARRDAKTLARTGTNHMASQARIATVGENEDVIIGWEFVAVIDSRTSQQCSSLDGTTYKLNDPNIPVPPLHPNCRSTLVYEIDGRYSYDDSASERPTNFRVDGKQQAKRVSSKRTYYEEMRKLKAADQDAILGPTLGKAFRKMDDPDTFAKSLIDDTYNPLTIEQMRRRDNQLGRVLRAQQ